ncbi:MAG: LpqB family beta-propeller domain-containing protein [Betaproteobacteria bacterium]
MTDAQKAGWRSDTVLCIGAFIVDPAANELHRDGQKARLRPMLMDVLLRLAAVPGHVVTRDQLIADVWARRMVNDEVLSRAVAELRTALGDGAREPQYIETLPKVGYRLIAAVSAAESEIAAEAAAGPENAAREAVATDLAATRQAEMIGAPQRTGMGRRWMQAGLVGLAVAAAIGAASMWRGKPETTATLAMQLGGARSFAADADLELTPRFSGDGKLVIYAQGQGRQTRLVLRDVAGTILSTVVKPGVLMLSPRFVRGDERIVYWQRSDAGCAIVERQLASGAEREIIDCARDPQPQFDVAPDGTYLVASVRHRAQHPYGLARIALVDGRLEAWTTPQPAEGDDGLPRFSPDGTRLVFSRGTNSTGKLWLIDAAAPHAARPLLAMEGRDYGHAWLGRDGPLLVAADWTGYRALHRVDIASGQIDLVGARGARFPDVSPNGDIVFESATYRADLWLTAADSPGTQTQMLWPSSRYTNQPVFSPDGKQVVFVSNREGAEALYVGAIGGPLRRLTLSAEHRHIRPQWSNDGARLYAVRSPVSARQYGAREAVLLDPASGRSEVLEALGRDVADVRQLPDGSLLVGEVSAHAMRLARFRDGRLERLALPLVSEVQTSGDDLVYLQPDLPVLTRCRLSTMRCEPLPVSIADADRFHWQLGKNVLWYRARSDAGALQLMKLDLVGGVTAAFDFPPTGSGASLASSADGTQLIVTREAPTIVDLMLAPRQLP